MSKLPNWFSRDWRAAIALALSAGGAVALIVLLWLMAGMLLPEKGWSTDSEGERVTTIRWVLWICAFCILLLLTGLGFSASRRELEMKAGNKSVRWAGGDQEDEHVQEVGREDSAAGDFAGGEAGGAAGR